MACVAPCTVLITGASGGIGGALAQAYAAPGVTLILLGRNSERLDVLAAACRDVGATVLIELLDLADTGRLQECLLSLDAQFPLDLVIANAGININMGDHNTGERWEEIQSLLQVNVIAAMATLHTEIGRAHV